MRKKVNMKRYFQVLGICLAVLLVGLLGGLGFGYWHGGEEGLTDDEIATVEATDGKINVLLMGVDEGGLRTDSIMLVSFNTETKDAKLLSIPRDTRMYIGSRYQKINAAHAISSSSGEILGAQGTVEAVNRLTGVPINYYVEMAFDDVAKFMDLLGPVTFEIPDLYGDGVGMVYDDPAQDLHINLKPGVQELNGEQVVHLLRYRKGNLVNGKRKSYLNGDIDRIAVQQDFIQAVIDQKLNASLILKLPALFKQMSESVKTNFSVRDVIKYSKYLDDFSSDNLDAFSLPGNSQYIDGVSYFVCDLDETRSLIETEFGYDASNITIDKTPSAKPSESASDSTSKPSSTEKAKSTSKPKSTQKATSAPTQKSSNNSETTKKPSSSKTESPEKTESAKNETVKTEAPEKTAAPTKKPEDVPVKNEEPEDTKTPVKEVSGDNEDEQAADE